ncbi:gonadotropin-releasing hormone II receptor-like [Ptychodera flava]|uniref:gonadotropin-releasing hormone II receptor-like n=1 Tax=Ptychodera flava TaxID=63121 RepID=UPI00396A87F0
MASFDTVINSTSAMGKGLYFGQKENPNVSNWGNYTIDEEHTSIWTSAVIQRVTTICVIMLFTIVGNSIIITVITCGKSRRRSSRVNIFILNLAVGDLFVCFVTMATEILFVAFGHWVMGEVMCKLLVYGQIVTLASTTFILTVMSFDRFQAICKPLSFSGSLSRAKKMIFGAWTLAFIFAVPQLFIFVLVEKTNDDGEVRYFCKSNGYTGEWQRKVYFTFMTAYILVIPATIISYCYIRIVFVVCSQGKEPIGGPQIRHRRSRNNAQNLGKSRHVDLKKIERSKIKTIKMTLCIIVAFVTCWSPYFIVTLQQIYGNADDIPEVSFVIAETMALANSAINPLLYGFFNLKIQQNLLDLFCPRGVRHKNASRDLTEHSYMSEESNQRRSTFRVNNSHGHSLAHGGGGYMLVGANSPATNLRCGPPRKKSIEHCDYHVSSM